MKTLIFGLFCLMFSGCSHIDISDDESWDDLEHDYQLSHKAQEDFIKPLNIKSVDEITDESFERVSNFSDEDYQAWLSRARRIANLRDAESAVTKALDVPGMTQKQRDLLDNLSDELRDVETRLLIKQLKGDK